jgi:Fic family protein
MRERLPAILEARDALAAGPGTYPHWDQLRRRTPPAGFSTEEWWLAVKLARLPLLRELPLKDAQGRPYRYAVPDEVLRRLHETDRRAAGRLAAPDVLTNRDTRDRYLISSLIEEAITSSQLEGAATTRQVAADMLRTGRQPADEAERMILNNFQAMQWIRSITDRPLTPADVLELHRRVTEGTLRDPQSAGQLQAPGEQRVSIVDRGTGQVLFSPPPASQLPDRLALMCRFANGECRELQFLHPVIRAILLHFWLAHDHPFEDGNGRTARALFYWSMLRSGYWLFEYVSISSVLRRKFVQYGRSYLYCETDENDATYFVIHQLKVLLEAIDELDAWLKRKLDQLREIEGRLRSAGQFNHRQLALLGHALRHPGAEYTIRSHQQSHGVAYATARADLLALAAKGLLRKHTIGAKTLAFRVPADLEARLGRA